MAQRPSTATASSPFSSRGPRARSPNPSRSLEADHSNLSMTCQSNMKGTTMANDPDTAVRERKEQVAESKKTVRVQTEKSKVTPGAANQEMAVREKKEVVAK